jgi:hypothetical protein
MFDLFFVLVCYIVLFILFFYVTYSNYSTYVKLPFYIIGVLLLTYVTYVVSSFWSNEGGTDKQIFEIFKRFFVIYSEYILIIIAIFILCIIFYKLFMGVLVYTLAQSIWVSVGLIILILALVKNTLYKTSDDGDILTLIKDIIFYIPCLITDGIDFIKKDYAQTPSTTFIVFILILVYAAIFFLMSIINTDGGSLLISEPKNLNSVERFSTDILLGLDVSTFEISQDQSYNNVTFDIVNIPKTYPTDKITQEYLDKNKSIAAVDTKNVNEGFTSLVEEDTYYDFGKKSYNISKDNEYTDINLSQVYDDVSNKTSQNLNKVYSGLQSLRDLFIKTNNTPYIYNYALSFWLYINTFHFKKISKNRLQTILTFGKRVSLIYDNIENDLIMLLNDEEVYRSKGILYQRWNHVVINSNDSKIDIFINNNLVGTHKYHSVDSSSNVYPPVTLYDSLVVGSTDNNNFGNICNFRYYNNNIDLSKIQSIYKKYNKKTPPL